MRLTQNGHAETRRYPALTGECERPTASLHTHCVPPSNRVQRCVRSGVRELWGAGIGAGLGVCLAITGLHKAGAAVPPAAFDALRADQQLQRPLVERLAMAVLQQLQWLCPQKAGLGQGRQGCWQRWHSLAGGLPLHLPFGTVVGLQYRALHLVRAQAGADAL